jgi:hypothetical protein
MRGRSVIFWPLLARSGYDGREAGNRRQRQPASTRTAARGSVAEGVRCDAESEAGSKQPEGCHHEETRVLLAALDFAVPKPSPTAYHTKRLSDEILVAFHLACDQREIDIASELLHVLEFMAKRNPLFPAGEARRVQQSLVAAHERLWQIRHAENGGGAGVRLKLGPSAR